MEAFFDHERLEVYQVARELNREIAAINAELPRAAAESGDNLRRAGASLTRNLAEANGRWSRPDKARVYHIARGSGMEVGASLDELVDFAFVAPDRIRRAKSLASRVVSMIMGLIRAVGPIPDQTTRSQKSPRRRPRRDRAGPAPDPDPDRDRDRQ